MGAAALGAGTPTGLQAQTLAIDPLAFVVSHSTRAGSITLINTARVASEVRLDVVFGFAATDTAGRPIVRYDRTVPGLKDASPWIAIYPRRLLLRPGQRQVIRLRSQAPDSVPPGEYWARVVVTARGGTVALNTPLDDAAKITVGLNLEARTVLPLFYRVGPLSTGLQIDTVTARLIDARTLTVGARMTRTGNAAWVGTMKFRVRDATTSAVVATYSRPVAVYTATGHRWQFEVPASQRGRRLVVELEAVGERADLPKATLVPTTGATHRVPVEPVAP